MPPRGEQRILSAIEVVSASRSMAYISGRSRVFVPFLCRVTMCVAKIVVEIEAFFGRRCSKGMLRRCTAYRHSPAHHRSSGTISSTARHLFFNNFHRVGEAKRGVAFPQSARSLFHVRVKILGFPMLLLTVEEPKVPLSRKIFGFVALRCYAEECAFSLSPQAQDHAWDLAEYKRVEPAHCPTGATFGGIGCERNIMRGIPPPFFMRAPCSLHNGGVRT